MITFMPMIVIVYIYLKWNNILLLSTEHEDGSTEKVNKNALILQKRVVKLVKFFSGAF